MGVIRCLATKFEITDLTLDESQEELKFFVRNGFDLLKDIRNLRDFRFQDQYEMILNSLPHEYLLQGDKYVEYRGKIHKVSKIRFKDESRGAPKDSGFRIVCLCKEVGNTISIIPFHAYTHSGAKGKNDLTQNEKKMCRAIVDEIEK